MISQYFAIFIDSALTDTGVTTFCFCLISLVFRS